MTGDIINKFNNIFSFLNISKIDEIKLREIVCSIDEESLEEGSIYNLISERTNKDNTTIQKFLAKVINNTNEENFIKEMGVYHKPKSKELLIHIYKKIKESEDN